VSNPYAKAASNPYAKKAAPSAAPVTSSASASAVTSSATTNKNNNNNNMLWVDKYKPKNTSEILGNQEAVKKLGIWLKMWESRFNNPQAVGKAFSNPNGPWKAALLSGPPGIGTFTLSPWVVLRLFMWVHWTRVLLYFWDAH
jgi:replication factor C subunit 1